jgi:hypothetical protein
VVRKCANSDCSSKRFQRQLHPQRHPEEHSRSECVSKDGQPVLDTVAARAWAAVVLRDACRREGDDKLLRMTVDWTSSLLAARHSLLAIPYSPLNAPRSTAPA